MNTTISYLSSKEFRQNFFRPVEGVFLFHPRAWERLIGQYLYQQGQAKPVPLLDYFLLARADFLRGLEDENPEALSVIEGLELPEYIILLPMPPTRERHKTAAADLLASYWQKRLAAEAARAWLTLRWQNNDFAEFGAEGLEKRIGKIAWQELSTVLVHDKYVLPDTAAEMRCAQFIGLMIQLKIFAPALLPYYFPAIKHWQQLDEFLAQGGLTVSQLVAQSRPKSLTHDPQLPDFSLHLAWQPTSSAMKNKESKEPLESNESNVEHPNPAPSNWLKRQKVKLKNTLQHLFWFSVGQPVAWLGQRSPFFAKVFAPFVMAMRRYRADFYVEKARTYAHQDPAKALQLLFIAEKHRRCLTQALQKQLDTSELRQQLLENLAKALLFSEPTVATCKAEKNAKIISFLDQLAQPDSAGGQSSKMAVLQAIASLLAAKKIKYIRINFWSWLGSWGKKPLRLHLPLQAELRTLAALRQVQKRLEHLPWDKKQLDAFQALFQPAIENYQARLRQFLQPLLKTIIRTAGFVMAMPRDQVSLDKIVKQIITLVEKKSYFGFSDLRDIIARNDLRLPDPSLKELFFGDQLIKLHRLLLENLSGIYRGGDFYLTLFQQLSAVIFGNVVGRNLTRFIILPFGIAFLALEGSNYLYHLLHYVFHDLSDLDFATPAAFILLGLLLNLIFYTQDGKKSLQHLGHVTWQMLIFIFYTLWTAPLRWRLVRELTKNKTFKFINNYVFQPFIVGFAILLVLSFFVLLLQVEPQLTLFELLFVAYGSGFILRNTNWGKHLLDTMLYELSLLWGQVKNTFFIGFIGFILDFFEVLLTKLENILHYISDLIRYRQQESHLDVLLKLLLQPLWGFLSFFIRLYVTVLVEPQINPIKHFPVVTVAHKLILPLLPSITLVMLGFFDNFLPRYLSLPFVTITIILFPGFFGFLVWELKENWRLYAASHRTVPQPVMVGDHGETLQGMLKLGFHSGTIPRAFRRLRKVLRQWQNPPAHFNVQLYRSEQRVRHAQEAIANFLKQELIASVFYHKNEDSQLEEIVLRAVDLASQAIFIELAVVCKDQKENLFLHITFFLEDQKVKTEVLGLAELTCLSLADQKLLEEQLKVFCQRAASKCLEGERQYK